MKFLFFFTFFLFSFLIGNGQVPATPPGVQVPVPPQGPGNIPNPNAPLDVLKLRDADANMILDMIQRITGRYILRPQNLPQVKINFDSMSVLTISETLMALESLLAMNGLGLTEIDSLFYKAVPAGGMSAHVPIWLDVPPSSLPPSQAIYMKMFHLQYVPAEKMREILNPFATPNVSSLITFTHSNSLLVTDSLLNLQRFEKIILQTDEVVEDSQFVMFWYTTKRLSAESIAKIFDDQWEQVWKDKFFSKPHLIQAAKINLSNPTLKRTTSSRSSAQSISGGDSNSSAGGGLEETNVASSAGGMADLPVNKLGVTCHESDRKRIIDIITDIDLDPDNQKAFTTFWHNTKRFTAEQISELFTSQWTTIWKNEFFMLPAFITTSNGDQLGVVCRTEDEVRLKEVLKEFEVDPSFKVSSKLIQLYHASADEVFDTLKKLLSKMTTSSKSELSEAFSDDENSSVVLEKYFNPETQRVSSYSNLTFSTLAYMVLDSRSNGIFVFGIDRDLTLFESIINELDTPLPMARIDTIFVMVDLTQANQRGIDALFQDLDWRNDESIIPGTTFTNDNGTPNDFTDDFQDKTPDTKVGAKTLTGGLKLPLLNSGLEFELQNWKIQQIRWNQIFALSSNREDVRIFSTPSITVSHGQKGKSGGTGKSYIEINDERRVGLPGVTSPNGQTTQPNLDSIKAKTRLEVNNPRIRKTIRDEDGNIVELGTVFMSITVTAEKFDQSTANTYEGQNLPTTKGRTAVTDIAIRDGQIMALGGFQEVSMDEKVSKYNFLSDIPYLGKKLFTPTQKRYTPTELMIFIRPTIIDPENPLDDLSTFNAGRIDSMMRNDYTPVFRSPSGKIFGTPDKKITHSEQDRKSNQPSL